MQTPYYLVEEDKLRRNLALIRDVAERSGAEIILAFKAFALWKTFPIFREYISHTTASSPDEARLALEEFGSPAHTYSPAYTERDFPTILRCSSHITFNSLSQFERFRLATWGGSFGLRVNPEYSEIETELYNPCAPGSRFGVLADDLPEHLPAGLEGFHIHCHCESSADTFVRTLNGTLAAHRCYLPVGNPSGAPMRLRIVENEGVVTAINDMRVNDGSVRYIDMNGRVSNRPFNGINIVVSADGTVTKAIK